jgi:Protein of unknown function (DUF3168)
MTALATRSAIDVALRAEPSVQSVLGNPARLHGEPVTDSVFPHAVWRNTSTRPNGSSHVVSEVHDFTLEVRTLEVGADVAEQAVTALAGAINSAKPTSSVVHFVVLMTTLVDVMRSPDGRTFRGLIRLRAVVEPKVQPQAQAA